MMHGDLEEAKRTLAGIARPTSHNPTSWAEQDESSVEFFNAFASHFSVELGIEDWPIRSPATAASRPRKPNANIQIHDRGVVPHAVASAGREDLVASAVGLGNAQLTQIAEMASKIVARGDELDPGRAVGLAAIEYLSRQGD